MARVLNAAPDWTIDHWLNTPAPLTLAGLRGRTVLAVAFQMLCPGCVAQALPQAQRAAAAFAGTGLTVIGLHTVFEHHTAQGSVAALAAFCHEYRIDFPVGIDAQADGVPVTMRRYAMQGTPTTLLIDADGRLRMQKFGHLDDMRLAAAIAGLLGEPAAAGSDFAGAVCTPAGCD